MRSIAATAVILLAASVAEAAVRPTVTPQELATAINKADAQLVPYRAPTVSPRDVRNVRCVASDEEPTELRCKWQQRVKGGWFKRTTWVTIDANGLRVIDA